MQSAEYNKARFNGTLGSENSTSTQVGFTVVDTVRTDSLIRFRSKTFPINQDYYNYLIIHLCEPKSFNGLMLFQRTSQPQNLHSSMYIKFRDIIEENAWSTDYHYHDVSKCAIDKDSG